MRLYSFDILKLFTIYTVVWGHCIQHLLHTGPTENPVSLIIYSFHMPLFMTILGYFSSSSLKYPFIPFIRKKFQQLIYPCLIFGIYFCLMDYLLPSLANKITNIGLLDIRYNFWFLKSLFICYLITYIGRKLFSNDIYMILFTILCSICINRYNIPNLYPCFLLGFFLQKVNDKWLKNITLVTFLSGITFIILIFFLDRKYWHYNTFALFTLLKRGISFYSLSDLFRGLFRTYIGLIGSLFFISLFRLLISQKDRPIINKLSEYGQYTLNVYILQTIILEIVLANIITLNYTNFYISNILIIPLIALLVLAICIFLSLKINSSHILKKFFLGK